MANHRNYRFLDVDAAIYPSATRHHDPEFELDESDVYNNSSAQSLDSRRAKKPANRPDDPTRRDLRCMPSSLPVNIPDWSKILREEYRDNRRRDGLVNDFFDEDDDDEGGGDDRVPPHEFLARTRMAASFSVHEGVGRTLKGRDLSRVRNAIWAKTGFQD